MTVHITCIERYHLAVVRPPEILALVLSIFRGRSRLRVGVFGVHDGGLVVIVKRWGMDEIL